MQITGSVPVLPERIKKTKSTTGWAFAHPVVILGCRGKAPADMAVFLCISEKVDNQTRNILACDEGRKV